MQATLALSNRLTVLAGEVRAAHQAIRTNALSMAEHAVTAGRALIEAKAGLAHGQWDRWLIEQVGISGRTARRYMQLARSGMETATVADLGIRAASEALARRTATPAKNVDDDPDFQAWFAEMRAGWEEVPPPEVRAEVLSIMRQDVAAAKLVKLLHDHLPADKADFCCKVLDEEGPAKVLASVRKLLKQRSAAGGAQ